MEKIIERSQTKPVMVKNLQIGGNNKLVIQSMTTTKTKNIKDTIEQIKKLEEAGCELVRVACPTIEDAKAIQKIKQEIIIPIAADIHFDHKIALEAIKAGADKIRINPGNIGREEHLKEVVNACLKKNIPIRIGVNSGSLEKHILRESGHPTARGMIKSAQYHVQMLENLGFTNIIISLKSSDLQIAIKAYEQAATIFKYPLHLGITEAGTSFGGSIKSSIGLGILINQNIGSTMRVSLSDDPVEEIKVAKEILKNFGLVNMPTLVSCPTCGRIEVNMLPIAKELEKFLQELTAPIKVSILGCAVNGPGEAKEADIGIACGKKEGLLFKKGQIVGMYPDDQILEVLKKEILKLEKQYIEENEQ